MARDNNSFYKESILRGSNPNLTFNSNLRGETYITDELLHSVGLYSKKDIEEAKFNKFSRFGRILDPYGRMVSGKEYLFFVKPDLHIVVPHGMTLDSDIYKNSGSTKIPDDFEYTAPSGLTLNPQLTNNSYFRNLIWTHPNVVKELQYSADPLRYPFSRLLSFSVNGYLNLDGVSAATLDNPATIYGTSYKYLRDFESSDENNTFSLEFLDDKDLNTYHFFKAYTEYHNARKSGLITPPSMDYYKYKRLHNMMGIYKFIIAEDAETIIYWAYFCGVFPEACPREAFGDPEFNSGLTFSVPFEAAFIEDMNPLTLYQFNKLMRPFLNVYGCGSIDDWLPVVRQAVHPDNQSYDPKLEAGSEMTNGTLPVVALVDGRGPANEPPKYKLRWYAPKG